MTLKVVSMFGSVVAALAICSCNSASVAKELQAHESSECAASLRAAMTMLDVGRSLTK
jgi:hypothetical protein